MSETGRWEAFRKCYYKCVQLTVALVGATLGTVAKRRVLVSALCFLCPINDRDTDFMEPLRMLLNAALTKALKAFKRFFVSSVFYNILEHLKDYWDIKYNCYILATFSL